MKLTISNCQNSNIEQNLKKAFNTIDQYKDHNFIISKINHYHDFVNKEGPLKNVLYIIKDNIAMKNTICTGGSAFLKNYKSPFNATVVELLNKAGAVPIAKSNLDEFGLGGTGLYSYYGEVLNPYDKNRIAGGSSSGSAVAVAVNACAFALGTDTGDSTRRPASFLGIVGYKPSYGLISRNGVFPFSPSLDHVGLLTHNVKDIYQIMNVIAKKDENDYTTQTLTDKFEYQALKQSKKIAIIIENNIDIDQDILALFNASLKKLTKLEFSNIHFDLQLLKHIPVIYQVISYPEAVSCYKNMTGITFGSWCQGKDYDTKLIKARTAYFGQEFKRRSFIGSYFLFAENYHSLYEKVVKIKNIINDKINQIFDHYDAIICLGAGTTAPLIEDIKSRKYQEKIVDSFIQIGNLSGLPSITVPMGKIQNMPIGINITCKKNNDLLLLSIADYVYNVLNPKEEINV